MADDSPLVAHQYGDVLIPFENSNITLTNVFLIPNLVYNLVLGNRLADKGKISVLGRPYVKLYLEDINFLVGIGQRDAENGLDSLPDPRMNAYSTMATARPEDTKLWYRRLAHMNFTDLCSVHEQADGVPNVPEVNYICSACCLGK